MRGRTVVRGRGNPGRETSQRSTSAPCNDQRGSRRLTYEERAAELKRQLQQQNQEMAKRREASKTGNYPMTRQTRGQGGRVDCKDGRQRPATVGATIPSGKPSTQSMANITGAQRVAAARKGAALAARKKMARKTGAPAVPCPQPQVPPKKLISSTPQPEPVAGPSGLGRQHQPKFFKSPQYPPYVPDIYQIPSSEDDDDYNYMRPDVVLPTMEISTSASEDEEFGKFFNGKMHYPPNEKDCVQPSDSFTGVEIPNIEEILSRLDPAVRVRIPLELIPNQEEFTTNVESAMCKMDKFFKYASKVEKQLSEFKIKNVPNLYVDNCPETSTPERPPRSPMTGAPPSLQKSTKQRVDARIAAALETAAARGTAAREMRSRGRGATIGPSPAGSVGRRGTPRGTKGRPDVRKTTVCRDRSAGATPMNLGSRTPVPMQVPSTEPNPPCPPSNPIIETAQAMLNLLLPQGALKEIRYTMLYTCLEWALSQFPDQGANLSPKEKMISALLNIESQIESAVPGGPEKLVIRPGEVDPKSITVINILPSVFSPKEQPRPVKSAGPAESYNGKYQLDNRYLMYSAGSLPCTPSPFTPKRFETYNAIRAAAATPTSPVSPGSTIPSSIDMSDQFHSANENDYVWLQTGKAPYEEHCVHLDPQIAGPDDEQCYDRQQGGDADSVPPLNISDFNGANEQDLEWIHRGKRVQQGAQFPDCDDLSDAGTDWLLSVPDTKIVAAVAHSDDPRTATLDMMSLEILRYPS